MIIDFPDPHKSKTLVPITEQQRREEDADAAMRPEQNILGGILLNAEVLDTIRPILEPDDFSDPFHGLIYSLMVKRRDAGEVISVPLLCSELPNGKLGDTQLTAHPYVKMLRRFWCSLADAPSYAREIRLKADKLRAMTALSEGFMELNAPGCDFTRA